jgi:crotonobetainyl-CoA:carnitine CoA-transferase CaiB-like acyl-CoA transferase
VALAAFGEEEFRGLCRAMDRMDLFEKYPDPLARLPEENAVELLGQVAAWAAARRVEEVEALASRHGFAASRVLEAKDVYHSAHYRERGAVQEYEDPLYGTMVQQCYPPVMSETPGRLKWSCRPLGFDNGYVLKKVLGLPEEEVKRLRDEGVVFQWNPNVPSQCPPPGWDGKRGVKLG